jgi:hypothetical protein
VSSAFKKPKSPKIPKVEPIEDVQVVEDTAEEEARKRKKNVGQGGRQSTVLSGIQSALKRRLGE